MNEVPWLGRVTLGYSDGSVEKLEGVESVIWKKGDMRNGKVIEQVYYETGPAVASTSRNNLFESVLRDVFGKRIAVNRNREKCIEMLNKLANVELKPKSKSGNQRRGKWQHYLSII